MNPVRRAAVDGLADALKITSYDGHTHWVAEETADTTSVLELTAPLEARAVTFGLFLDIESTDPFALEASRDDGETWTNLSYLLDTELITEPIGRSGLRQWQRASADLPAPVDGVAVRLRWVQARDTYYAGRGLLVDAIRLRDDHAVIVDTERDPSVLTASGWSLSG